MKKTLLSALVVIALTAQLTGCNGNTPVEQPNESSSVVSVISEPHNSKNSNITQNNNNIPQDIWSVLPEISVTDVSAFKYNYDSNLGGMVVTDYLLESPKVRIPDYLEDEPVVKVDLSKCSKQLTELILPDTVTEYSLSNETKGSLQYINIPNMKCYKSMNGLKNLTAVAFGNGVTGIKRNSFSNCPKLTEIYLSDSVSSFAPAAFEGCSKLEKIIYNGNAYSPDEIVNAVNQSNSKSENDTSESDFEYEESENGVKITNYVGNGGNVKLPEQINGKKVISVGYRAFALNDELTSVYIPNGVTELETSAFLNCTNLASVNMPDSLIKIGKYAFNDCYSLTSIDIPNGVTEIGEYAFVGCTKLTSINVAERNSNYCSFDCILYKKTDGGNLSLIHCPDGVEGEITIPDSVTYIGYNAFFNARGITKIRYKGKTYSSEPSYWKGNGISDLYHLFTQ